MPTISEILKWSVDDLNSAASRLNSFVSNGAALTRPLDSPIAGWTGADAVRAQELTVALRGQTSTFIDACGAGARALTTAGASIGQIQTELRRVLNSMSSANEYGFRLAEDGDYIEPRNEPDEADVAAVAKYDAALAAAKAASNRAENLIEQAEAADELLSEQLIGAFGDDPGFWESAWDWIAGVGEGIADFAVGFWDGTVGAVIDLSKLVYGLTIQGLYDPDGWKQNWSNFGNGMAALWDMAWEDPEGFFKLVINYEDLQNNPAHWAGGVTGGIVAALLTGGLAAGARAGKVAQALGNGAGVPMTRAALETAQAVANTNRDWIITHTNRPLDPASPWRDMNNQVASLRPSPAEQAFSDSADTSTARPMSTKGINGSYRIDTLTGQAIFKPSSGDSPAMNWNHNFPLGNAYTREVAAYRTDQLLGFDLVPPTTVVSDAVHGVGSMQELRAGSGALRAAAYDPISQQQMAVLDYVVGSWDRHGANYLTGTDGRPVAVDHGYTFPTGALTDGNAHQLQSSFTYDAYRKPLDAIVLDRVRAVDADQLRAALESSDLEPSAVQGGVNRLIEVQRNGMITGENWPGIFIRDHKEDWLPPLQAPASMTGTR